MDLVEISFEVFTLHPQYYNMRSAFRRKQEILTFCSQFWEHAARYYPGLGSVRFVSARKNTLEVRYRIVLETTQT